MSKFKYIKREWKNGKWRYTYPEERANDKTENAKYLEKKAKEKAREEKLRDVLGYDKKDKLDKAAADLKFRESNLKKNADLNATKQHADSLANYEVAKLEYDKTLASKIESAKAWVAKQKHINELKSKTTYPEERASDYTEDAKYLKARRKANNDKIIKEALENEIKTYTRSIDAGKEYVRKLIK